MKTPILIALLSLAVSSWAQGVVDFRNGGVTFPTPADRFVYRDQVGGSKLVGTNYVAGLWFVQGADATAVDGRISPERGHQAGRTFTFRIPTTSSPGTWNPAGTSSLFTLDGVSAGEMAMLQVRVWDSVKFPAFADALAAGEY